MRDFHACRILDIVNQAREYLTIEELATLLHVPVRTIYAWRSRGKGPPAYRIGRYLRFRVAEVETWVDQQASDGR